MDYIVRFMMYKCKRRLRSQGAESISKEVCFNESEIDYDSFRLLKAKLAEKPQCIVDLIEDLVGYKP